VSVANGGNARNETSAGGVVIRRIDGVVHVLLIHDPYGHWGLPKGHLEEEEELAEAGLREVREETGLSDLELGPELGTIDWHYRMRGRLIHKHCTFFLMTSQSGDTIPELEEGITECRWIPMEEAVNFVTYDNAREVVQDAARRLEEEPALHESFLD
jgi:8-oxo-dGTP pyrophosphatase MutT (NUDIX family)